VPLIAVHPTKNIKAHFRHSPDANGQERECADPEGANESIVHSVAKKAIGELSKLWLIGAEKGRGLYKGRQIPPYLLYPKGAWDISAAKVEDHQFSSRYVPDVLCKTSAGLLAIEVYYRHRVDQTKRERLVQDGLLTLEVDFSNVDIATLGRKTVLDRLYSPRYASWLNVPIPEDRLADVQAWDQEHIRKIDDKLALAQAKAARERQAQEALIEAERQQYLLDKKNLHRRDLHNYVELWFKNKLHTLQASPFFESERREIRKLLGRLRQFVNNPLLPEEHVFGEDMAIRNTNEIARRVDLFRASVASDLTRKFMAENGNEILGLLIEADWQGEDLESKELERGLSSILDSELIPSLDKYLRRYIKVLGVNSFKNID
jgi:hypothetical protein